ncbi:hypothetical protein POM88_040672 [Heracleum sosnowskyi]|uniref:Uncharacterized protein n=1 Tax=Heracleum sosnowskyi TaxID=360622 RepID=A0AAD8HEI3_9APIA|nr:hypothetical protein POM88_040672 [Heracleum sosnowskyi]
MGWSKEQEKQRPAKPKKTLAHIVWMKWDENTLKTKGAKREEFYNTCINSFKDYYEYPKNYLPENGDRVVRAHLKRNFRSYLNKEKERLEDKVNNLLDCGYRDINIKLLNPHYFSQRTWNAICDHWGTPQFAMRADKEHREAFNFSNYLSENTSNCLINSSTALLLLAAQYLLIQSNVYIDTVDSSSQLGYFIASLDNQNLMYIYRRGKINEWIQINFKASRGIFFLVLFSRFFKEIDEEREGKGDISITDEEFLTMLYDPNDPAVKDLQEKMKNARSSQDDSIVELLQTDQPPSPRTKMDIYRIKDIISTTQDRPPKKGWIILHPQDMVGELIGAQEATRWTSQPKIDNSHDSASVALPDKFYQMMSTILDEVRHMIRSLPVGEVKQSILDQELRNLATAAFPDPNQQSLHTHYIRTAGGLLPQILKDANKVIVEV